MGTNFHEHYTPEEIREPSERSTGLVFSSVAVVVAAWWRDSSIVPLVALSVAALLAFLSLSVPRLLKPLNRIWFRIGNLLQTLVNPLVMLAMFAVVFVPGGFIMRIWRDPLRSRRTAAASTYWIKRSSGTYCDASMKDQF